MADLAWGMHAHVTVLWQFEPFVMLSSGSRCIWALHVQWGRQWCLSAATELDPFVVYRDRMPPGYPQAHVPPTKVQDLDAVPQLRQRSSPARIQARHQSCSRTIVIYVDFSRGDIWQSSVDPSSLRTVYGDAAAAERPPPCRSLRIY